MVIVGLTGGLGTGKTTAAEIFASLGAKVLNADDIVHDLLRCGSPCFKKVVNTFGEEILAGKDIDRKKLAAIIFNNAAKRKHLEGIVHPVVIREIKKEIKAFRQKNREKVFVVEVPLLFEAKMDKIVDVVVVVKANQKVQFVRVKQRHGLSRRKALKRMKAQMPMKEKIQRADIIIDNRGALREVRGQVKKVFNKLERIQK
ncbi:MAG: dephospho-CoA kinase [Candidatus Omnitrophica bacterium]|nr:dephospho-CoA kinase [Candidatus Omnitrophota bacterium]